MSILPGVIASGISGHLFNPAYEGIASTVVSGSSIANFTFSNIPQSYAHLELRFSGSINSASTTHIALRFNSDGVSGHYYYTEGYGDASGAFSKGYGAATGAVGPFLTSGRTTAVFRITDYTNTSIVKSVNSYGGYDNNGSGRVGWQGSMWQQNSAITSITVTALDGSYLQPNTYIGLYGIKGLF